MVNSTLHSIGNKYENSQADSGGTFYMVGCHVTFTDDCFTGSYAQFRGGAILTTGSKVKTFNITIRNSSAQYGGGMVAMDSHLEVFENTFEKNRASYGGGLYVHNTDFHGNTLLLTKNSAIEGGGGIYASRSTIYFMGDAVMITNNSAMDGGGLLLSGDSEQLLSKVQLFISLATSLAVLEVRSR